MAINFHDRRASQQSAKSSVSAVSKLSSRVTSRVKQLVRKFEDLDQNHLREKKRFKLPERRSHSRFWSTPVTTQRYNHTRISSKSKSYKPISASYSGKRYRGIPNQDGPADTVPTEPRKSSGSTVSPNSVKRAKRPVKKGRKTEPIHETDEDAGDPLPEENIIKRRATIFSRLASHRKKAAQPEPQTTGQVEDHVPSSLGSPEGLGLSSSTKLMVASRRSSSIRAGVKTIISIFNRRRPQDTSPPSSRTRVTSDRLNEERITKVSPENIDNYRGVDFRRLDKPSRKTRQSSSGIEYPSGVLPPGFFDPRCSSVDITSAANSDQQRSNQPMKKYVPNPSYGRQFYYKEQAENSTERREPRVHPGGPAKAGLLYSQNRSASTISLSFKDVEKAFTQRSSPSHKSGRSGPQASVAHNPSSGNHPRKAKAASKSDPNRSRGQSPSAHVDDLTVRISTGQKSRAGISDDRHGPISGPSSDEAWSSHYNLSASYSTNSVGSFAILHSESDGLLGPDDTDRGNWAEETPSPTQNSTIGTDISSSTGLALPTLHPALARSNPKRVPTEISTHGSIQVSVGIDTDSSRRHHNSTPLDKGSKIESRGNTPGQTAASSPDPEQRRRAGTPVPAYWIEDRRLGNGVAYNSSILSETGSPNHRRAEVENTPTKYVDRRTTPEDYLRGLPQPSFRVVTEDDSEFYDESSYEGDSESDNEELTADDIAILESAKDFRAPDSCPGSSQGGVSLPAGHTNHESVPQEPSPTESKDGPESPASDKSRNPTFIYSSSEGSGTASNHTIHITSTPGNSSGSGETLVSHEAESSQSQSHNPPVDPIIGGAGEMTLGELAAYLSGPRAAEDLQDGAASMTVHVPIMGMPPCKLHHPQPKSLIQVKEIRRMAFRWSCDAPAVDLNLIEVDP